jgi:hypothetical protein
MRADRVKPPIPGGEYKLGYGGSLSSLEKINFPVLINNDDLPEEGEGELWAAILIFLCHPHASC